MLRITEMWEPDGAITLRLEGRITGPWVDELRRSAAAALVTTRAVTLDLSGVSFLDVRGLSLLRDLQLRAVVLTNCSPYIAEQIKEMDDAEHHS
jgi:ABC-type transporter Mla MlaB component